MADGAVIPLDRTAVPVEWDEVKKQLERLATDLGPTSDVSTTSVGRFIDSAANALAGNGEKLRQTLAELSGVSRVLADGSGDFVGIIKNLQIFVTALKGSNDQIVAFNDRLATLSSVLDGSKSDLDAALTDLSVAITEVKRFVAGTRNQTAEQLEGLRQVSQTLVDVKTDFEQVLHVAPNSFANGYNIYDPDTGSPRGGFSLPNLASPMQFVCGMIGATQNTTAPETAKLCHDYLGPALRLLNLNYIPVPISPYLSKSASPHNIVYADPALAPGGAGGAPRPPENPPDGLGLHRAGRRRAAASRHGATARRSVLGARPPEQLPDPRVVPRCAGADAGGHSDRAGKAAAGVGRAGRSAVGPAGDDASRGSPAT